MTLSQVDPHPRVEPCYISGHKAAWHCHNSDNDDDDDDDDADDDDDGL